MINKMKFEGEKTSTHYVCRLEGANKFTCLLVISVSRE